MARVNVISDGQPLTYDILNQIITEVNKIKEIPDDLGQSIVVDGPAIGRSDKDTAKIISGIKPIDIKANEINVNVDVTFDKGNFSKDSVVVVASVVDRNFGKRGGGAQMSTVTVTDISSNGFSARVQILKAVKQKSVSLELHYIAIGAGPLARN